MCVQNHIFDAISAFFLQTIHINSSAQRQTSLQNALKEMLAVYLPGS